MRSSSNAMTPETIDFPTGWADRVREIRPDRRTLLWAALLVNAELIAVLGYISLPTVTPTAIQYYVYPFVWINVGLWAVVRTARVRGNASGNEGKGRKRGTERKRYAAGALATGYFLVLAYVGGLLGPGHALVGHTGHPRPSGFRLAWLPPGWGPAPLYNGPLFELALMPFMLVGYLALAYLVYATVLDAVGSAIGGFLGLLSCVSCTWPVLASLVGGVAGGTGLAAAVTTQSYGLSTVVFCVTVGLLYWRPFGR